jgi:hypothetical protein
MPGSAAAPAAAAAGAAAAGKAPPAPKVTFTERIQARVVPLLDKAAVMIAGSPEVLSNIRSNGGAADSGRSNGSASAAAPMRASDKGAVSTAQEVPDSAAAAADDSQHIKTAAARAKLKGALKQRAVGSAASAK